MIGLLIMIKLLVIIYNKEKRLKLIFRKYNLNYQIMANAMGTANNKILKYLGLNSIKKNIYYAIIPSNIENYLFNDLKLWCNIEKKGNGIAFIVPISSSSKFVGEIGESGENNKMFKKEYELIVTIVSEGFSDYVMHAAHLAGCNGGTVIKGRSVGSHGTIFMDISIEPEKEMVLNIVPKKIKKEVMESITKYCGVKTDARGVLISLPIDNVIGLEK